MASAVIGIVVFISMFCFDADKSAIDSVYLIFIGVLASGNAGLIAILLRKGSVYYSVTISWSLTGKSIGSRVKERSLDPSVPST